MMTQDTVYLGRDDAPPGLKRLASGKVRDIYELDAERLLFVTTDRVSAFDVVMNEGIPHKGRVLTAISAWWFANTGEIIANHLLSTSIDDVPGLDEEWRRKLEGRIMIVNRCEPTEVEWVVRGYVVGSGWKEYQDPSRLISRDAPSRAIGLSAGGSMAGRSPVDNRHPAGNFAKSAVPGGGGGAGELAPEWPWLTTTRQLPGGARMDLDPVVSPLHSSSWVKGEIRAGCRHLQ